MSDTLKAKEQLSAIVDLFTAGKLAETAAIVVIPRDSAAPSSKWSLSNRIIQAIHGTGDARGIKQWNTAGRSVKAGSKAFCILGPSIIKDKVDPTITHLVGFHGIPVFRVEDTRGDALPSMEPTAPPLLAGVAEAFGLSIRYAAFSDKYYGYYAAKKQEIVLCTHEQEVFFHELGHAAHERVTGPLKGGQDSKQEIVAEMTACVLARVYGIQAHEDKMQRYVESYAEGKDLGRVLMGLLSEIQKTVDLIITTAATQAQAVAA